MTVHIDIPRSIEELIKATGQDVSAAIREAALVEFYRRGVLSHGKLAEALGLARAEVDALLTRHGVTEDLTTPAELDEQLDRLRRITG